MTAKQPQAGEYWQKEDTRLCIVGTKKNGVTVGEMQSGALIPFMAIHDWQHLPDCDSFDWRPEVYPQYWTSLYAASDVAYVVREDDSEFGGWYCAMKSGTNKLKFMSCTWSSEGRTRITKEQAEALLSPQESPDDWVTQDRVPPRAGIDQFHWSNWESSRWVDAPYNWDQGIIHGYRSAADDAVVSVRCRRKDLPVVPSPEYRILRDDDKTVASDERSYPDSPNRWGVITAMVGWESGMTVAELRSRRAPWRDVIVRRKDLPAQESPKRVAVRLWASLNLLEQGCHAVVYATESTSTLSDMSEVHSDGNGWYVEVQP